MKKFIVLPIVFLLLCGCSKTKKVTPILDDISFVANINYGDDEYVCDVTSKNDALNLVIAEPEEIKGLLLSIDKNGIRAEFNGVSFEPDVSSIPQSAVADILLNVFEDVSTNESIKCKSDNCVVNGKVNDYEYIFTIAPSGLPIRLEIKALDFTVEFNNVTIL